jgi:tetratricopeptide (TPR) repeat protein
VHKALETHAQTSVIQRAVSDPEKEQLPQGVGPASGPSSAEESIEPSAEEAATSEAETEEAGNRRARRAAAARARKDRVREREEAQAVGLDAQEILDDAFARSTDTAGKWLKKNINVIQWLLVGGITVWAGWGLYGWQQARAAAAASDKFAKAANAQFGKVGEDVGEANPDIIDPTPTFADDKTRLEAAQAAYEESAKRNASDGTGLYSRLALAAVLSDQGKFDEAKSHLDEVLQSKLARTDAALRARALEGVALALEGKGDKAGALATYEKAATESGANGNLAKYNQARLLRELNRIDDARKVVTELYAQMPPKEGLAGMFPGYLEQNVKALAQVLGVEAPKAAPPAITPAQIRDLASSVQKTINEGAKPAPAPVVPTPTSSAAPASSGVSP